MALDDRCWVTMTDRFMSGWGPAKGKKNKLVLECVDDGECNEVQGRAERRPEMRHVNIVCGSKPPRYSGKGYHVSYGNRKSHRAFYPRTREEIYGRAM